MPLCEFFIKRPVATTLLTVAMLLCGILGYFKLPVSYLPRADAPTIVVQARQPGGSPEEIAGTVAAPLEKRLGQIDHITEMTSRSSQNMTRISLQFSLDRDINGAARDVEAALQAARADMPSSLRQNPQYWKSNPAGSPVLILTLTSDVKTPGDLYDYASNILQQTLASIDGVGEIEIGGSALPAIRVDINPYFLFRYGLSFEDVRAALAAANARTPKGVIEHSGHQYTLNTNDQIHHAQDYRDLIIAWRANHPIHLDNVARITDGVEDVRRAGFYNGKSSVIVVIFPQVGSNMINTVDKIYSRFPMLRSALPNDMQLHVSMDRSTSIRAALADTQLTLFLSVVLVVVVVLFFLQSPLMTIIPAIFVPTVLISTFAILEFFGFSLDLMSLMALTISTGFVVDDAIVVIENITRHAEDGLSYEQAAIKGSEEITFTLISISISLMAVLLPVLLGGGPASPLFKEFAITLYATIAVSLILSLTLTPMLTAKILAKIHQGNQPSKMMVLFMSVIQPVMNKTVQSFTYLQNIYTTTLYKSLAYRKTIMFAIPFFLGFTVIIFHFMPKSLFPEADSGTLVGHMEGDQAISFQSLVNKIKHTQHFITDDPDVQSVATFVGGSNTSNEASFYLQMKDKEKRKDPLQQTMRRITKKFNKITGIRFFMSSPRMIHIGARKGNAAFQYTLESENASDLYYWTEHLQTELQHHPQIRDISSDAKIDGLSLNSEIDRDTEARVNITPQLLSNTLFDAFGQRAASVIYSSLNQYRIIMESNQNTSQDPEILRQVWISTSGGSAGGGTRSNTIRVKRTSGSDDAGDSQFAKLSQQSFKNMVANSLAGGNGASSGSAVSTGRETMVPFSVITQSQPNHTPLAVNHQGLTAATTISFNLGQKSSLSDATEIIEQSKLKLHMPPSIHSHFSGGAQQFQKSSKTLPLVILAAILTIYITLGILYESFIHPLTILSTLPPAACGALIALRFTGEEFSLIALIGMMLLMGIVQKNAILLIDFAITAERTHKETPINAILTACKLRFRPIMMTSIAAALGAAPLLVTSGYGSEIRHPLGTTIVGGIIFSQLITLYTTPVFYVTFDLLRSRIQKYWSKKRQTELVS